MVHSSLWTTDDAVHSQRSNDQRLYATEQLGRTRRRTPEGFLIVEAVPLARTGTMLYAKGEIGDVEAGPDGVIYVERVPEEVFKPAAMASFEGKPLTNDHPPEDVTPDNWRKYAVGHVQNVRRGDGVQDDLMLGDLLITDKEAIQAVEDGKVELSNGYNADYEQIEPGKARQLNIIGNHVALVDSGRCGSRCAIGDHEMKTRDGATPAAGRFATWRDRLSRALKAKDAEQAEQLLGEMPGADAAEGEAGMGAGATHVHLHMPAGGTAAAKPADDAEAEEGAQGGSVEERLGKLEACTQRIEALLAKLAAAEAAENEGALGTEDEEGEAGEEGGKEAKAEGTGDKTRDAAAKAAAAAAAKGGKVVVRDSKHLATSFDATLALAECLAPGLRVPTFDATLDAKATLDRMCAFRRRVLDHAYATEDGKALIAPLLDGEVLKTAAMTCDAVSILFKGAATAAKAANNQAGSGSGRMRDSTVKVPAPVDINKRNAEFWAKKS